MTSVTTGPAAPGARPQWAEFLRIREVWGSLAIGSMWLAVAVSAVWGSDFVSTNAGSQTTTIPSGIWVAFFACIASAWVAKRTFR